MSLNEGKEAAEEALEWLLSNEGRITLKPFEFDEELSKVRNHEGKGKNMTSYSLIMLC